MTNDLEQFRKLTDRLKDMEPPQLENGKYSLFYEVLGNGNAWIVEFPVDDREEPGREWEIILVDDIALAIWEKHLEGKLIGDGWKVKITSPFNKDAADTLWFVTISSDGSDTGKIVCHGEIKLAALLEAWEKVNEST